MKNSFLAFVRKSCHHWEMEDLEFDNVRSTQGGSFMLKSAKLTQMCKIDLHKGIFWRGHRCIIRQVKTKKFVKPMQVEAPFVERQMVVRIQSADVPPNFRLPLDKECWSVLGLLFWTKAFSCVSKVTRRIMLKPSSASLQDFAAALFATVSWADFHLHLWFWWLCEAKFGCTHDKLCVDVGFPSFPARRPLLLQNILEEMGTPGKLWVNLSWNLISKMVKRKERKTASPFRKEKVAQ